MFIIYDIRTDLIRDSILFNWRQHYQNNGGIPVSHAHYKIFLLALVILKSPAMLENLDGIER